MCTKTAAKAQKSFLSSLPVHEARLRYLVSVMKEVSARNEALAEVSATEWVKRVKALRTKLLAGDDETKESKAVSEIPEVRATESSISSVLDQSATTRGPSNVPAPATVADSASNQTGTAGSISDDEEESEAAAAATAHLREAAIAQMAELGLPRSWSEFALRRTGGDIEAAVHFLLENGGEMERLLADERERERLVQGQAGDGQASRRRGQRTESGSSNHLLTQLLEMGFPSRWCTEALAATGNNVDEALTWILTHGERLSEEDEAMDDADVGDDVDDDDDDEEEDDGEDDEDEDDEDEDDEEERAKDSNGSDAGALVSGSRSTSEVVVLSDKEIAQDTATSNTSAWSGSVVPLRFISGRSIIDSKTLAISGLPTGGFSSVGTKGVLLCSGKWYYEAILETAGCSQIGWADGSFAGHCHADRGDGTGDGPRYGSFLPVI